MIGDVQWTETGDRYMLKLFRDYVFHQVTSNGQPWVDLSHIVQCLNKVYTFSLCNYSFYIFYYLTSQLKCSKWKSSTTVAARKYV